MIIHFAKVHNNCKCRHTKLWLDQSTCIRKYKKLTNITREDSIARLEYRERTPKYRRWIGTNPCLYMECIYEVKPSEIEKNENAETEVNTN